MLVRRFIYLTMYSQIRWDLAGFNAILNNRSSQLTQYAKLIKKVVKNASQS